MTQINEKKAAVQLKAGLAFMNANWWGAEYIATGVGKTKLAINLMGALSGLKKPTLLKFLIAVPTQKLRDSGWKDEFIKWREDDLYSQVQMTCYASLHTIEDQHFDFVILDEGHNITYDNSEFFRKNQVGRCLLMTATKPTDLAKISILKKLGLYTPVFEFSIQQAVELGVVAPYDVTIVHMKLDNKLKNIKAGSKGKYYYLTEQETYDKKYKRAEMIGDFMIHARAHFIKSLPSKTVVAKLLLQHIIPVHLRTLIFCGSRRQAIELCDYRYFSKPTAPKKGSKEFDKKMDEYEFMVKEWHGDIDLLAFSEGLANRLSCVSALNEGENLEKLDVGFIPQLEGSKSLPLVQQTGRIIRLREDHRGTIILLCVDDTVDEKWVNNATAEYDQSIVRHVQLEDLRLGKETILFN